MKEKKKECIKITFEGDSGAGKTILARRIEKILKKEGIECSLESDKSDKITNRLIDILHIYQSIKPELAEKIF